MNKYIPVVIVVLSNTFYHISAKSAPGDINTFASLTVTYLVGALVSAALFFITCKQPDIGEELQKVNWSTIVLGIAIIGLEAGFLLMYRVGWTVSTAQIVSSAVLAVVLIFVGYVFYKEQITLSKAAGVAICMAGLYLINK